jgi:hypothetical protein
VHDLFLIDKFLFVIVVLFGIFLPVMKMIASVVFWYCLNIGAVRKGSDVLGLISKFSMLDVMLLAIFVIVFKGVGVGTIEVRYGLYIYASFVLASLALGLAIGRAAANAGNLEIGPELNPATEAELRVVKRYRLPAGWVFAVLLAGLVGLSYYALLDNSGFFEGLTTTDLSDILKRPKEFDGRDVTVWGTVVRSVGLFGVGGYLLKQGDAEIYVVSSHGVPTPGTQITVSGSFKQAFAVGGYQYAVIIER